MEFKVTHNVSQQDIAEIHSKLKAYNLSRREASKEIPIGVFLEDENGVKKAGLTGEIYGNWLCIKYLWVSAELRNQGFGSKLQQKAEADALSQGARYVFVDTFDFQAPAFYRKQCYQEVFRLFDYPYTGERCYYIKHLVHSSPTASQTEASQ